MKDSGRLFWLVAGLGLGLVGAAFFFSRSSPVLGANSDRHQDFVLCTGTVSTNPRVPTDGVWLLDYRSGKLLGTVVDRGQGKITGWAEADLVNEFNLKPGTDAHFLMTTGQVNYGQAALYIAETTSGKFAVYTMGQRPDSQPGVMIRRHDMLSFRPSTPRT